MILKYLSKKFLQSSLNNLVNNLEKREFDGVPKISVYDLKRNISVNVNGDSPGWSASIIKVPIMATAFQEVSKGNLNLEEKLKVNHKFTLEPFDFISTLPEGAKVSMPNLMYAMIVNSDNEATNMIADRIGIQTINKSMVSFDMKNSMLAHLLCPNVPRYTSEFNKDGSNITTPNDMVNSLRQIYDKKFSKLDENTRKLCDIVFSWTENYGVKSKGGYISDPDFGEDIHEAGIIDNRLIYTIMLNKVGQKSIQQRKENKVNNRLDELYWGLEPLFNEFEDGLDIALSCKPKKSSKENELDIDFSYKPKKSSEEDGFNMRRISFQKDAKNILYNYLLFS